MIKTGRNVDAVSFDPTSGDLASVAIGGPLRLWDIATGNALRSFNMNAGGDGSLVFAATARIAASGGFDGQIRIWDTQVWELLSAFGDKPESITSLDITSSGRLLASSYGDGEVRLWDVNNAKIIHSMEGAPGGTYSVSLNPSGILLATGGENGNIRIWHVENGQLYRKLEGHSGRVNCVQFSPDNRLLASKGGHGDSSVRIWRTDTGACVSTLSEPASDFWQPGLAFHPKLSILATVGSDQSAPAKESDRLIHLWHFNPIGLLSQKAAPVIGLKNAKVVILGESNVGKSYLAHRIATGTAPLHNKVTSTHGMKIWRLDLESNSNLTASQERRVTLWDMGGQHEYRLIHQLFLTDTLVALMLVDPTRGRLAFEEVADWDKRLGRQLHGKRVIKLLVGAKMDEPSEMIDHFELHRFKESCGFAEYYETSALNGRGIDDLRAAIENAIDWDSVGKTIRSELSQRIRDEINTARSEGRIIYKLSELNRSSRATLDSPFGLNEVNDVVQQLATEGSVALSQLSTGEKVIVLNISEVERYAGSLILAARNNPRGVPALELRRIGQSDFTFPEIRDHDRLSITQEQVVLDATVQLVLEHGVCFQHKGLLIFPSLFSTAHSANSQKLEYGASISYDFSGAIDNVYSSLISWLVLSREFGSVRLWPERAELIDAQGTFGVREVKRPSGFAHLDIYFGGVTTSDQRELFISCVEEHLRSHSIELSENVAITCTCSYKLDEETLRRRIEDAKEDVRCPVCDTKHLIAQGVIQSRKRNPMLLAKTWALKTEVEKRRQKSSYHAVSVLDNNVKHGRSNGPILILHLSDLHFNADTDVSTYLQWLVDDLRGQNGLALRSLDYLVISGDFTDRGSIDGFERAYDFVSKLAEKFELSAERCIFVPGNHDLQDRRDTYEWCQNSEGLKDGQFVKQGEIFLARNADRYHSRLEAFSTSLFHKFLQRPYPLDYAKQGMSIPFWESGLQFITLNSCWEIDQFHRKRASIHKGALAAAIEESQRQEQQARISGELKERPLLRIAVWHHAVAGPEQIKDTSFLNHLQKCGVSIALHGDVHEIRRDLISYWHKEVHIIGSGTFGARVQDRPENTPRMYSLLEIKRDFTGAKVHTRCQQTSEGPWKGWNEWPPEGGGEGGVPYYSIKLSKTTATDALPAG